MAVRAAAAIGVVALSLTGCGETDQEVTSTRSPVQPDGVSTSSAEVVPTSAEVVTTTAEVVTTTVDPTDDTNKTKKTDVYVVLRMDDISYDYKAQEQIDFLNWSVENKIPVTMGVINSMWPSNCLEDPSGKHCDSRVVQAFNKAHEEGHFLDTAGNGFIEIADHSYGHETWATKWKSESWVRKDFKTSTERMTKAFPNASLRTFIAPECLANGKTLGAMLDHGYDIISAEGQMGCDDDGEYLYAPCTAGKDTSKGECVPPHDVYFTEKGVNKMENGAISLPAGSANSNMAKEEIGNSVEVTIGAYDCGCHGDARCGFLPNARANAKKSHGLHWTVLMMHPQTSFKKCCKQTYKQWLEEFLPAVRALKHYTVHFVNFQGLAAMLSPSTESEETANTTVVL